MLCDFYELTMANGYYMLGKGQEIAYFDVFFRQIPDGGGFAIAAGLEQVVEYIRSLEFTDDAFRAVAKQALEKEIGARGLRSILEGIMTGPMYTVPSLGDVEKLIITEKAVLGKEEPTLIRKEKAE